MGRILYLDDPKSESQVFIIEPTLTAEENERNKRKINMAGIECLKQVYIEYLEQKDLGVDGWEEYFNKQLEKYPKSKKKGILREITVDEMDRLTQ